MSKNRLLNFSFGIELTQGFTKSKRDFDFATRSASDKSTRNDHLVTYRVNWTLPLYLDGEEEEIYY